jgi:hypothetical protein
MSFDLYLISFENEKTSGISASLVKDAFGGYVDWKEPDHGLSQYSGGNDGTSICLSLLESDPEHVDCISVNRPLSDLRSLDALFRIMCLGNVALIWPGCSRPLIAKESAAIHIPQNLGKPIVIQRGSEITEQIEGPALDATVS